ncbi:unnamed protein product [Cylindrotheca closterium]|uniref:2-dehydropantoate 2-reductase n=1 Tax=Cylindrotheca closterium TaxID=2856 RepID=A0AAD2JLA3_9STRA|nr:unnamed protein product [Cylindrotheca closterium]
MRASYFRISKTLTVCVCQFIRPTAAFQSALYSSDAGRIFEAESKPSVAVVGVGAVGGYYGARLWDCGAYDVKFHMRGDNFSQCKKNGLDVKSVHGDIHIPSDQLQAYTDTSEIGKVDWVVVALKSTSLNAIPSLVSPLLDPERTRIIVIMNGLIENDLIKMLKEFHGENVDDEELNFCKALYGGMALLCSNRVAPGSIEHSFASLLSYGVAAHSADTTVKESLDNCQEFWKPVKNVETRLELSLLGGRWRKNVWNLPFNGISVAMGGITVDKVVEDEGLRKLAYEVMDETIAIANAELEKHGYDSSLFLGDEDKEKMFDLSDNMGPYKTSTMIDLTERRPMEVQYLFQEPLKRARSLGVDVPHLETIVAQICALQKWHGLF